MRYKWINDFSFILALKINLSLTLILLLTLAWPYKPPDQLKFLEPLPHSLNTLNMLNKEWHTKGHEYELVGK